MQGRRRASVTPATTYDGAKYEFADYPGYSDPMRWPLDDKSEQTLIEAAKAARLRAYAPYSRFQVGAALLVDDTVIIGCNVENASYGLCLCAERSAVAAAIAQGKRRFQAIAVVTASSPASPPCGMCRQVLSEFAPELPILLIGGDDEVQRVSLDTLFPSHFDGELLRSGQSSDDEKDSA